MPNFRFSNALPVFMLLRLRPPDTELQLFEIWVLFPPWRSISGLLSTCWSALAGWGIISGFLMHFWFSCCCALGPLEHLSVRDKRLDVRDPPYSHPLLASTYQVAPWGIWAAPFLALLIARGYHHRTHTSCLLMWFIRKQVYFPLIFAFGCMLGLCAFGSLMSLRPFSFTELNRVLLSDL